MQFPWYSYLVVLLVFCPHAQCYNILVTVIGITGSHNLLTYRLGELYAEHGHNVTMLRAWFTRAAKAPKLDKINRELVYDAVGDEEIRQEMEKQIGSVTWKSESGFRDIANIIMGLSTMPGHCDVLLDNAEIMDALKSTKFDVIVIHMFDVCSIGLAHHLGIKSTAQLSSGFFMDFHDYFAGAPHPVAVLPSGLHAVTTNMSLRERFGNMAMWMIAVTWYSHVALPVYTWKFRSRFGSDFPHLRTLLTETQLWYANSDSLIDFPRAYMPNMINIGGFMMEKAKPKPLDEQWRAIAESPDAKKHGFILFSLGSVVKSADMPMELKMNFLNAFKRLKQPVIWKFEGEFPEARGTNVHLGDWLPQTDLLGHPNIALFLTHGGFNSVMESAMAGVPIVVMPMFGDQFANAKRVVSVGYGLDADIKTDSEDQLYQTMNTILTDERFMKKAKKLSAMIEKKPINNREQAVRWIEYLAEFQTLEDLQSASKYVYLYQYFLLDIFLILAVLFSILVFCCFKLTRLCCCSGKRGIANNKHKNE